MDERLIYVLIGSKIISVFMVVLLVTWVVVQHRTIQGMRGEMFGLLKELVGTLKDLTHTVHTVINSVEQSSSLTKEAKGENIEMLRQTENRIIASVERIERAVVALQQHKHFAPNTNVYNTNATGGQTNQGGDVKGDQR